MSMESFLPGEILDVILVSVFVLATFTTLTMPIWTTVSFNPYFSLISPNLLLMSRKLRPLIY